MRTRARSSKDKIRDLKKVVKGGLSAILSADGIERITAMIVLPGNGRSTDQPIGKSIVANGKAMTFTQYQEWCVRKGVEAADTSAFELTIHQETTVHMSIEEYERADVTPQPLQLEEPAAKQDGPITKAVKAISEAIAGRKDKRSAKRQQGIDAPAIAAATGPRKVTTRTLAEIIENAVDAEEIEQYNREIGKRLIRPFRIG